MRKIRTDSRWHKVSHISFILCKIYNDLQISESRLKTTHIFLGSFFSRILEFVKNTCLDYNNGTKFISMYFAEEEAQKAVALDVVVVFLDLPPLATLNTKTRHCGGKGHVFYSEKREN